MPQTWTFEVPGKPVTWKRTANYNGKRVTPKDYRAYKKLIQMHARNAGMPDLGSDPVGVEVVVYLENKRGQGDGDNYLKACNDSLEHIVFDNDRQVVFASVRKVYGEGEKMVITVWREEA